MRTLTATDVETILSAHEGLTLTLSDAARFFLAGNKRTVSWACSCGASGSVTVDLDANLADRAYLDRAVRVEGRKHLAAVLAMATALAARPPHPALADVGEAAERYYADSERIIAAARGGPSGSLGTSIMWRIDASIVDMLSFAGHLTSRQSLGQYEHELHGVRVQAVEPERNIVLTRDLAEKAAQSFEDVGQGGDAELIRDAITRATELDGEAPVFELVIS